MTDWTTCPGCGLKHSPRPDGLCPRCRTRTGAAASPGLAPQQPLSTQPFPSGPPPLDAAPLPTTAWGGGAPTSAPGASSTAAITVGSIVSKTFAIWRAHFWKFFGTLFLAYLPILAIVIVGVLSARLLQTTGAAGGGTPPAFLGLMSVLGIAVVAFLPLMLAQFGGVVFVTLQHLAGKTTTVGAMLGFGLRRAWPLFATSFLAGLLVLAGFVALVVPGVIAALGLSIVYAIPIAEKVTPVEAIKRSFALTKGNRGTVVGAIFVVMVAMWAASLIGNVATAAAGTNQVAAIVGVILNFVAQIALTPLSTVAIAVAYHDLRVAKEGVDTTQLAKVFE